MKKSIKAIFLFSFGFLFCLTFVVTYASTYNSEEISYDTSTSGAVQANVKDALDFLYNKTKSGASAECPENMSCVEKPGVVMNVTGPGTVDKGTVYVGLNESNTFTVTPDSGYTLASISCDNGYTLGTFKTLSTEAMSSQEIEIINPGVTTGASCSITFSTNEIIIQSSGSSDGSSDSCNSNSSGCICYQIKHNVTNFTYGSHTGCNFKSKTCKFTYISRVGQTFNCANLEWFGFNYTWVDNSNYIQDNNKYNHVYDAACSGVITCAT